MSSWYSASLPSTTKDIQIRLANASEEGPLLESFYDNRVRSSGVERIFAGDLMSDIAKCRRDFISNPADFVEDRKRCRRARSGMFRGQSALSHTERRVLDQIIFSGELRAVVWEQGARGIVEKRETVDVALGVFDSLIVLLSMVADADELHEELFSQEDQRRDEKGSQNLLHDVLPFFRGRIFIPDLVWIPSHKRLEGGKTGKSPAC